MTTTRILTASEAVALATLVEAAYGGKRVARLVDATGDVLTGTARSVGDDRGNYAGPKDDVRDCLLRVTLESGFEAFWPVADLVAEVGSGVFCIYDGR